MCKKSCIFLTGGTYAPYAPCMSTPLPEAVSLRHPPWRYNSEYF